MRGEWDRVGARDGLILDAAALATHTLLFGFGFIRSRHRPKRSRDIRTTVFVHGLAANRAGFFPMQGYLGLLGHRRQYSSNYKSTGTIEALAAELGRKLSKNVKGGRIDIVAHSMGGLVARYWLQALGGHRRVDRLVTLATPHHGAHPSALLPIGLVGQLRPGGRFISELNRLPAPPGVACTSIAAGRDLLVLPGDSAYAPFGERRCFDAAGHLDILLYPTVFNAVHDALTQPVPAAR